MKRILSVSLIFLLLLGCLNGIPVKAESTYKPSEKGVMMRYEYTISGGEVTITGVYDPDKTIYIPDTLAGYPVTRIGEYAFQFLDNVSYIYIGKNVTHIEDYAFDSCSELKEIAIPDNVTHIGDYAFTSCNNMTSISIGKGVVSIGNDAISRCLNLTGIWVDPQNPVYCSDSFGVLYSKDMKTCIQAAGGMTGSYTVAEGVVSICDSTFYDCHYLTDITIPSSVTQLQVSSFFGCSSLEGIWIDPQNSTYCSDCFGVIYTKDMKTCFRVPGGIEGSYTVPDFVTCIGDYAFSECTKLTDITIGNSVTHIEDYAFMGCTGLTDVTIPDCVVSVGIGAFSWNNKIHSITFGNGVTDIGDRVFSYNRNMTEVTFGSQVSSIGANAFVDCYNLRKITFLGDAPTINQGTLASVTATAYYPAENTTWTEDVMAGYGGKITWVACSATIVDRWNVVLESDLKVNFYLDINEHNSVKITLGDDCRIYNASDLEQAADGKYIATVNVSAAQMTDDILIQNTGHPDSHSYSIRSYCEAILANEQYSRYHDLVRELLHYGAMAQVYFDHHTENLADSGITGTAAIEIPETADELIIRDHITNLSFYGASLVYENRIAVRYYFTGDITGCSFTANGITYIPVAKDDKYYVEIADILPQNIDQQITFTVTDANGKTLTFSYSPMNYIIRMNNTDDGNRKNLLKALYNYHLAAKAFSIAV